MTAALAEALGILVGSPFADPAHQAVVEAVRGALRRGGTHQRAEEIAKGAHQPLEVIESLIGVAAPGEELVSLTRRLVAGRQHGRGSAVVPHDDMGIDELAGSAWPDPIDAHAFYGLAGDVVQTIEPTTEADPVALLLNFLAYFGNCAGLKPVFRVEDTDHGLNEFVGIVGATAKSRKGTADKRIRRLFRQVDAEWTKRRVRSGLSSGEGLIWGVRDPILGVDAQGGSVVVDQGEPDKRLLIVESELATVLRRLEREASSLSPLMRDAWDRTAPLEALVSERSRPAARAGQHHVSVIGHITRVELGRYLTRTEAANGLGNRFLWVLVKRARLLPRGASAPNLNDLVGRVHEALEFTARLDHPVDFDEAAAKAWDGVYGPLSEGKPGLLGAIIARGEAHVVRLALVYAVLDLSPVIRRPHLLAALALWDFAEGSARCIFGEELGDPDADAVLAALRASPEGLTTSGLRDHFQHNWLTERISRAVCALIGCALVTETREMSPSGKGRPTTRYRAVPGASAGGGLSYLALAKDVEVVTR
ncbi:MAG: DUF3987 domain-containing protein [Candidatus Dormibacteria bacterium]